MSAASTPEGLDAQDELRIYGFRGFYFRRCARDIDVIALHEKRNHDHEDDQQHEHDVDEWRDVDLRLQFGA